MDFDKLTTRSKETIEAVIKLAATNKNQYITPLHLLKVLTNGKHDVIRLLITQSGGNYSQIVNKTDNAIAKLPQVAGASVQSLMSQEFTTVMMSAETLASQANDKFVTIERLLQALSIVAGTWSTTKFLTPL